MKKVIVIFVLFLILGTSCSYRRTLNHQPFQPHKESKPHHK